MSRDCAELLPVACGRHRRDTNDNSHGGEEDESEDDGNWTLSLSAYPGSDAAHADCPAGYAPKPPRNGYANTRLWLAALGQRVWIHAPVAF
jgi:hypothetical protein